MRGRSASRWSTIGAVATALALFMPGPAVIAAPSAAASRSSAAALSSAGDVQIDLYPNSRHQLVVHLFPRRGIAAVTTYDGDELRRGIFRANSYAVAIEKSRFSGSIHVHFRGLGEIVGSVLPKGGAESGPPAEVCGGSAPTVDATFRGRIHFRDPGSHGPWSATRATASIAPQCSHPKHGFTLPKELLGAVEEVGGLTIPGPAPFAFFAHSTTRRRAIQFIVFGDDRSGEGGVFAAIDDEWLPGEVATQRVASRPATFPPRIEVDSSHGQIDSVTFEPPAPFFGSATFTQSTSELRGSLGVRFLGLKAIHLARPPLSAELLDEEPRR